MSTKPDHQALGLIGRDDVLIKDLIKVFHAEAKVRHDYTPLRPTDDRRGYTFEVRIHVDGEATAHVARVTVALDRIEN